MWRDFIYFNSNGKALRSLALQINLDTGYAVFFACKAFKGSVGYFGLLVSAQALISAPLSFILRAWIKIFRRKADLGTSPRCLSILWIIARSIMIVIGFFISNFVISISSIGYISVPSPMGEGGGRDC